MAPLKLDENYVDVNGIRLAYLERAGTSSRASTILFVHGVACHAHDWDATLRRLDAAHTAICIDIRGHGRSEKTGPYGWSQFGSDLCSFIQELRLTSIVGVGHSMGAHLLLQAASVYSKRFEALLLFEPAVFSPQAYASARQLKLFDSPEEHPFAKRRDEWESPQQWFDAIRNRGPFKLWSEEVLRDHCLHGLEKSENGRFRLCCPPLVEAEASLKCADTDVHNLLSSVNMPVKVFRAKTARGLRHPLDNVHSVTWAQLAQNIAQGSDIHLPELSHFMPMERPDLVAMELTTTLNEIDAASESNQSQ